MPSKLLKFQGGEVAPLRGRWRWAGTRAGNWRRREAWMPAPFPSVWRVRVS